MKQLHQDREQSVNVWRADLQMTSNDQIVHFGFVVIVSFDKTADDKNE